MNLERFGVKFFARKDQNLDDRVFIDIFQQWIQQDKLSGIPIDVVDYRHVPEGPGVMLITHHINFAVDYTAGRFGLLAQQKLSLVDGPLGQKILALLRATAEFAALLESDPRVAEKLVFEAGQFEFFANDRLHAPNTDAAYEALRPALLEAARLAYPGADVQVSRQANDPRQRLTLAVESGQPLTPAGLLARLSQPVR